MVIQVAMPVSKPQEVIFMKKTNKVTHPRVDNLIEQLMHVWKILGLCLNNQLSIYYRTINKIKRCPHYGETIYRQLSNTCFSNEIEPK